MEPIRGILFDLDGTLLNSKESVLNALHYTLQQHYPEPISYEFLEARFGQSIKPYLAQLSQEMQDVLTHTYLDYEKAHHDELVTLYPEVQETLRTLWEAGFPMAVVTNKQREMALRGLTLFELEPYFQALVTLDDVEHGKPDPEPVLQACRLIQVLPQQVLMVGDTPYDVLAAQRAGAYSAIVEWEGPYTRTEEAVPDYILPTLKDLVALFNVPK